jgi:hypothetical protein
MEPLILVVVEAVQHMAAAPVAPAALASLSSSTEAQATVYCPSKAPANGLAQQV